MLRAFGSLPSPQDTQLANPIPFQGFAQISPSQ